MVSSAGRCFLHLSAVGNGGYTVKRGLWARYVQGAWYLIFIWNREKIKADIYFLPINCRWILISRCRRNSSDLQESHRLLSSRTNTGRKITGADGIAWRGREGWALLLVTGSSVATPKLKLKAGGRISTCQKALSIITCFSTSVRKGSWKARMDSRGKWKKEMSEENTHS